MHLYQTGHFEFSLNVLFLTVMAAVKENQRINLKERWKMEEN